MTETSSLHIAVVGGGPGGYAAAFLAADLGLKVTLIDPEANPGGVCLYRGCIPSKALLHVAKLIDESRHAKNWGIEYADPKIDLSRLRSWKEGVVKKLTGGLGILSKQRKVEYIQGRAAFENSKTLRISKAGGQRREPDIRSHHSRDRFAAGDYSRVQARHSSRDGLHVGAGFERGTGNAAGGRRRIHRPGAGHGVCSVGGEGFGGRNVAGLLPGADRDLVLPLHKRIEKSFAAILLNTTVAAMKVEGDGIRVTFDGPEVKEREQVFEKVLVSVGRKPNSEIPGLDKTQVQVGPRGFIQVNKQLQTSDPAIYAIGDVVGEPMLAHKASHEGRTAVEAIAGHKVAFEPAAIPAVVFTDPEIAWCGLTETQAQKENREIKVAKFPWAASGRAMTVDRTEGMTKLILDPQTERVLGVGIVGAGAGELIAEGVLAVEMAALAKDIALTIHPHPTLSETVMQAAEVFFGTSTDIYRPKKS